MAKEVSIAFFFLSVLIDVGTVQTTFSTVSEMPASALLCSSFFLKKRAYVAWKMLQACRCPKPRS